MSEKSCVVIGIGNPIKSDDGIGIHVVRHLEGRVPEGVELVEGSIYCADMLPFLEGRTKAVFVDGIDAGEEPGAIFRFTPDEVRQSRAAPLSVHDFGLYELVNAARLLEQCPGEVVLISVQVKCLDVGLELSEELEDVLPRVCELVLEEISGQ